MNRFFYNVIFKQIYALKLFIAFKMAKYGSFSLGGNIDFPEFLQKKFYNINYWSSGYYVEETRVQWL